MPKKVKNTTFPGPLDLIAPHHCRGCRELGTVLCGCCKKHIIKSNIYNNCPKCKNQLNNFKCPHCHTLPPIYTIGAREGLLADLIHDYKYYSIRAIGVKLAELLHEKLPKNLPQNTIIIPLPTSTKHIRERGFDHTLRIAKHLAKLNKNLKISPILIRDKNTVQVGTDKKTRRLQAKDAYIINPKIAIDPTATYLLLDDVWTTGASMESAIQKLRTAGAKKIIIALLSISTLEQD